MNGMSAGSTSLDDGRWRAGKIRVCSIGSQARRPPCAFTTRVFLRAHNLGCLPQPSKPVVAAECAFSFGRRFWLSRAEVSSIQWFHRMRAMHKQTQMRKRSLAACHSRKLSVRRSRWAAVDQPSEQTLPSEVMDMILTSAVVLVGHVTLQAMMGVKCTIPSACIMLLFIKIATSSRPI